MTKRGRKKGGNGKLTVKNQKFVDFYIETGNASQSAIKAGYSKVSAGVTSDRLLKNDKIIKEIERRRKELTERAGVTAQRVIDELAKIAFIKSSDVFKYGEGEVELADGTITKKGIAYLKPQNELKNNADCSIASIKETNQGLEIKLYDKLKALDALGKYFGVNNDSEIKKAQEIKKEPEQHKNENTLKLDLSDLDDDKLQRLAELSRKRKD